MENLGIGNNGVHVLPGTEVTELRVVDTAVVDLTIGNGTTTSKFFLKHQVGDSLLIGDSFGDAATFNLLGGWLDTYYATIGGRATFNLIDPGSYWDSTDVLIKGDATPNTAGVGLSLGAQAVAHGNLVVGSDAGSGRVVVDGTVTGFNPASLWTVSGSVDVGPTNTSSLHYGLITLQDGGRMIVQNDARVHGHSDDVQWSTISVRTGGELTVTNLLQIGPHATLELSDSASKITTGSFAKTGSEGIFAWTAGTLEITNQIVSIDSSSYAHTVLGSVLTVGAGKKLVVSTIGFDGTSLEIGVTGTGSLTVEAGGDVESYRGVIGVFGTGQGAVTIRDNGSTWNITEQLRVGSGNNSQGTLSILNGGSVSTSFAGIGMFDSAHGAVTVDGPNSSLTSTGNLWIADGGTTIGTLTIQNQGTVTSAAGNIGRFGTPTGNVFVDGAGSRWNSTGNVWVGNDTGGSGTLTVRNSGTTTVGGTLTVNRYGNVNLQTAGKIHADTIALQPGASFADSGGTLVRTNRLTGFGAAPRFHGNLQLGHAAGSTPGQYNVGGQTLTVDQNLVVGLDAPASLVVESGGYLESGRTFIGAQAGSSGSAVGLLGGRWVAHDSIFAGGDESAARASAYVDVRLGGLLNVDGTAKVWSTGRLVVGESSTVRADAVDLNGGELEARMATLSLAGPLTNAGAVDLVGPLTVDGIGSSYLQTSAGTLEIEFYGSGAGQYGQLSAAVGRATLGGHLTGNLWGGYAPQAWDAFTILTADELTGSFASESLPAISGKPGLDWVVNYDYVNDLVMLQVAPIFTADFDEDGDVDGADLALWKGGFGLAGAALHTQGDADGDHDVDGADFLAWQRQLGSSAPTVSAKPPVPEPATVTLIVLAAATSALIRRCRVGSRLPSGGDIHDRQG